MQQAESFYSPEVEEYMLANNWHKLESKVLPTSLFFLKDGSHAVVFNKGCIEYKTIAEQASISEAAITFKWKSQAAYKSFDGKNIFQLMMLLDFMGAVKIATISRELRTRINVDHLVREIPGVYINKTVNA